MSEELIVSFKGMSNMVDRDLFNAIGEAITIYAKSKTVSMSTVEMTVAAFLGSEIGCSSENTEEIEVNIRAYSDFILVTAQIAKLYGENKKAMH